MDESSPTLRDNKRRRRQPKRGTRDWQLILRLMRSVEGNIIRHNNLNELTNRPQPPKLRSIDTENNRNEIYATDLRPGHEGTPCAVNETIVGFFLQGDYRTRNLCWSNHVFWISSAAFRNCHYVGDIFNNCWHFCSGRRNSVSMLLLTLK